MRMALFPWKRSRRRSGSRLNDVDPFLVQLEEMGQEGDLNTSYSRDAVRMDLAAADVIVVLAARIPPLALAVRHPIPT